MISITSIYLILKWAGISFCAGHIVRGAYEKEKNEIIVVES